MAIPPGRYSDDIRLGIGGDQAKSPRDARPGEPSAQRKSTGRGILKRGGPFFLMLCDRLRRTQNITTPRPNMMVWPSYRQLIVGPVSHQQTHRSNAQLSQNIDATGHRCIYPRDVWRDFKRTWWNPTTNSSLEIKTRAPSICGVGTQTISLSESTSKNKTIWRYRKFLPTLS